jgi:type VI secretion system protein ImpM
VIAANPAAGHRRFPAGWYGKIPAAGDFIARRIPAGFREAWDRWLQPALDAARGRLGPGWRDDFLSMPAWRFALPPGLLTPGAWAGVMVPSVDAVGRIFPLTIAAALPSSRLDAVATLLAAHAWFGAVEAVALSALIPSADPAAIDVAVAARPFPEESLREGELSPSCAAWLAEASEIFGRSLLVCEALPQGERFCAMLDGRWREHGWAQGALPQ